jgi:hypothetical protein
MVSLGRELAAGSDLWLTAEKVGRWQVGHQPLAGDGASRWPKAVSNPRNRAGRQSIKPRSGDRHLAWGVSPRKTRPNHDQALKGRQITAAP